MRRDLGHPRVVLARLSLAASLVLTATATVQVGNEEYAGRRQQAMERLSDGRRDPATARAVRREVRRSAELPAGRLFPLTGLAEQPGAILALDAPRQESLLFAPPPPISFGIPVPGLGATPGSDTARQLTLTRVEHWDRFLPWLRQRLDEASAPFYVDEPRWVESTGSPAGLRPVAGPMALWRTALEEAFPEATIASALQVIRELRWVKSSAEVELLRANAQATVAAFRAAAGRIDAGTTQRRVEAAVVSACLEADGQGPSFWPWTMSGPNAHLDEVVRSSYSYEHLDREMRPGELVRIDIGCAGSGYGADVGRTLPVNGHFDTAQAEVWDLLIDGYLAGLEVIADGVTVAEVRAASRARVRELTSSLSSDGARQAAVLLDVDAAWHLHGVGIESDEEALPVLRAGAVLAYEPMVSVGPDAFYLEDMIVVTQDGHEVLSSGLPYRAAEVDAFMARGR